MAFYILSGWLLFNVAFAFAMYFRPVRKPSVDSDGRHPAEACANASPGLSGVGEESFDKDIGRCVPGSSKRNKQPATLSRILFFGFWFNDSRHSA